MRHYTSEVPPVSSEDFYGPFDLGFRDQHIVGVPVGPSSVTEATFLDRTNQVDTAYTGIPATFNGVVKLHMTPVISVQI